MASELKVNKITPESGVTLTLGDSGDTINFGSGVLPNFENLTVTGDLTVDTNSLKVDSTNNFVGIGTASPTVALDVVGAITATGNITGTLATAAQPNITSLGTLTGLTTTGDINLGDSDKINFGASNDLQIYHDGSMSYIEDTGTGDLRIKGADIAIQQNDGNNQIKSINGGKVLLSYNGSQKFETTSTGIDVTGTVVSDGLQVESGVNSMPAATSNAHIVRTDGGGSAPFDQAGSLLYLPRQSDTDGRSNHLFYTGATPKLRQNIAPNGDISFYEDTGTTPKLFWDASAERLGIGTTSPSFKLDLIGGVEAGIRIGNSFNQTGIIQFFNTTASSINSTISGNLEGGNDGGDIRFATKANAGSLTERMRIDSSGNVGIGTSSPTNKFHVQAGSAGGDPTQAQETVVFESNQNNYIVNLIPATASFSGFAFSTNTTNVTGGMFYSPSNNYMVFRTVGTERIRITSGGNVGIGTTSPSTALDVNGTVTATAFSGDGSALTGISGGKIGQVIQGTDTTETSITSTSYTDTGLSASITPTSTSSKILVMWDIQYRVNTGSSNNIIALIKTLRGATLIGSYAKARSDGFVGENGGTLSFSYLDSPSTTSSTTYKTQAALGTSGDGRTFYAETGQDGVTALSSITLMEVLA